VGFVLVCRVDLQADVRGTYGSSSDHHVFTLADVTTAFIVSYIPDLAVGNDWKAYLLLYCVKPLLMGRRSVTFYFSASMNGNVGGASCFYSASVFNGE